MNIDEIISKIRMVLESKPRMSSLYIEETLTAIRNELNLLEIQKSSKTNSNPDRMLKSGDWSPQDNKFLNDTL